MKNIDDTNLSFSQFLISIELKYTGYVLIPASRVAHEQRASFPWSHSGLISGRDENRNVAFHNNRVSFHSCVAKEKLR